MDYIHTYYIHTYIHTYMEKLCSYIQLIYCCHIELLSSASRERTYDGSVSDK